MGLFGINEPLGQTVICEKCHKKVQKDRLGSYFCNCSGRSWVEYY